MVTIVRTGCMFVEADSEEAAMVLANHQTTDAVNWSDDWTVTDVEPDDSLPDGCYISYDIVDEAGKRG